MPLLNGKNKSKKPKFLLSLRINELINIPQSSGYCYVKWHLKEGTGTSSDVFDSNGEVIPAMNQSHGSTPKVMVENHRARWNFEFEKPLQIKLQVDRNRDLVPKNLSLEVFFEFLSDTNGGTVKPRRSNSGSSHSAKSGSTNTYSQKITGKILLGVLSLNVADYVREDEQPTTNRFLLKKSKVNSILNVTLQMRLVRGGYKDFQPTRNLISGQLPGVLRTGFNDILDDSSDMGSPTSSLYQHSMSSPQSSRFNHGKGKTIDNSMTLDITNNSISASMSPLVDSLYQRTFQLPWDPRPGEFTPRECVEDILQGGNGWAKNEKGICLIDLQALRLNEMENDYYESHKNGPGMRNNDDDTSEAARNVTNYDNMDKREYLEKKQIWSHKSSVQKERKKQYEDNGNSGSKEYGEYVEDIPNDKIRDAKSWSVNNIMT